MHFSKVKMNMDLAHLMQQRNYPPFDLCRIMKLTKHSNPAIYSAKNFAQHSAFTIKFCKRMEEKERNRVIETERNRERERKIE